MLMAFLLVVLVDDKVTSDNRMLFKNIYRCNEFAVSIEQAKYGRNHRPHYRQENITAYCVPKMVPKGTQLFD